MLHVTVDRKRKTVMDGVHVIVTIDAKWRNYKYFQMVSTTIISFNTYGDSYAPDEYPGQTANM